jgi:putative FmdB family regulatory protein
LRPGSTPNVQESKDTSVPLYEYRCQNCGHQFEKIQSFSAPDEKECPLCHGSLERLISAPAIQFKGSGWYVNDYASKASKSMKASAEGNGKAAESSGSADKSEKPATTAPSTSPSKSSESSSSSSSSKSE